jgi:glycosyltransferase involved in cell wall biosynthesis
LTKNKITVFTITYNCEQYIYRCYSSIINQSYSNWIWLIIDDGSSDNTENVIRNLKDVRIQYYKLENNVGRGKARNFGLTKVQTDWLAILDMDDLMLKSRLFRFNSSINCGFEGLITSTLLVDNHLKISGIRKAIYNKYFNLFTHASLCIKTNILSEISYSESRYAEDQRVIVLISSNCNLEICDEPLYVYQEDASINVRGAYLSNYYAVINLISTLTFSSFKSRQLERLFYILKFALSTLILYVLSKLSIGNKLYNQLIQRRVKNCYENHSIEQELKLYE